MMRMRVLVVEDEKPMREFVRRNLEVRSYDVRCAANGLEALAEMDRFTADLVILDVMMPNMDGLETIRRIRTSSRVPIMVLSALGEEADKIRALNLGADDYLTKPFGVGELLARVQAMARRAKWVDQPGAEHHLIHDEIEVDVQRHSVVVRGKPVDLTPTEFALLVYFMEHANKLLSHEALLKHIWGREYGNEAEYLRVYVGRLRQKVEADPANPRYFKTERGVGYVFES